MSGLNENGFTSKRLPQIKSELESALIAALGDLNLESETVLGQMVGIESDARSILWELLDDLYHSQYPHGAVGVNLDRVVSINGITRLGALPTVVRAVVSGVEGTVIPAGSLAKNSKTNLNYSALATRTISALTSVGARISVRTVGDNLNYTITLAGVPYTINSGSSATAQTILTALDTAVPVDTVLSSGYLDLEYDTAQSVAVNSNLNIDFVSVFLDFSAIEDGPNLLPVGDLDQIETPVAGWDSVTNRVAGSAGRDVETDEDLRIRRERSVRIAATNTIDGIEANLAVVDGVISVTVRQNNTDTTDSDGVPSHTVWAIVQGGLSTDIAQVLYDRIAGGIGTFGAEEEFIISPISGVEYSIKFDRPTTIPIHIEVHISGSPALPVDYVARVRDALVEYGENFKIGQDVIFTRVYSPINSAIDDDSYITQLLIDTIDPPVGSVNLAIGSDELAQILSENIDVLLD